MDKVSPSDTARGASPIDDAIDVAISADTISITFQIQQPPSCTNCVSEHKEVDMLVLLTTEGDAKATITAEAPAPLNFWRMVSAAPREYLVGICVFVC